MATLQEVETALRNADAAGDTDAASALAAEYVRLRDGQTGGVKNYLENQSEMAVESFDQMRRGAGQIAEAARFATSGAGRNVVPDTPANRVAGGFSALDPGGPQAPLTEGEHRAANRQAVGNVVRGAGNAIAGGLGYVASPINAAFRTAVGQPVEALTGVPKEYTEFAAQLATPGLGLTRLPKAPVRGPATPTPGQEVAQAGSRLGVEVPRAATSDSITVQQYGKVASNVPVAGKPLVQASRQAIDDLGEAADATRAAYGSGSPSAAGLAAREGVEEFVRSGPIKQRVTDLYNRVDALVNPTTIGPISNTRNVVNTIEGRRVNAALPESAAVKDLKEAVSRPGMNYEGVKDLRTYYGEMLDGSTPIPQGMSHGEVKQIYGALSADMRTIISRAGGRDGLRAYEQAEAAASRWAGIRTDLGRLLKVQSEEAIFDKIAAMAGSTARADLSLLGRVRGAVGPQNWDEISSAVIAKMGWPPGGTGFSPDAFLTAFNKMSPEGKRLLFRSTSSASHASAIDDIATVSQRFKELQQFANPSGTGRTVAGTAQVGALFTEPLTLVSSVVGARIVSHVLARPSTSRQMASWSRSYLAAATNPTPANMSAFERSSKVFAASVGKDFARPDLVPDLARHLQSMQGPMRVPAEQEQGQPEGVVN